MFTLRNWFHRSPSGKTQRRLHVEVLEDRAVPSTVSTIMSNFNGTAIPAGASVWFNSVAKVSGVPSGQAVTIHVTNESIAYTVKGATATIPVPDADITFS